MKKQYSILLVEDEENFGSVLKNYLELNDYIVTLCKDGNQGLQSFKNNIYDLCILDVMMPKYDGWYVLERVRDFLNTPIIMLTARSDEYDQLKGFKLGADDYVTKPFSPGVLMARVNKLLRKDKLVHEEINFGKIKMDVAAREVFVDGVKINLTPKEYELLKFFIDNKGIALSRDKILNAVWNYDYFGDLRTVDTHIKQLRAKLGKYSYYISTVRSVGYRLDSENEIIN